ncbi:DUF6292 family protein [Prauserella muralis]|uniref:Uncharacterized protein n=1 Tax=Prauserella muralis TaxID=588067 RepID=A0A2V4APR5_9PSEU|nr:DUF6292 family protein [Prauserella muralis]PXY22696.1 hypothetical protein BAY60_23060 [Prauserella muralis]TWE28413.1 hypothetical protein FHX69_1068 [Prauserella muralis]
MELAYESAEAAQRGLHGYVAAVIESLGLHGAAYCLEPEPLGAYVALDERVPGFTRRDAALLWDVRQGWATAIETGCNEDLIVVSYLGAEPVPAPARVADYLAAVLRGETPGRTVPPAFSPSQLAEVPARLRRYAATEFPQHPASAIL